MSAADRERIEKIGDWLRDRYKSHVVRDSFEDIRWLLSQLSALSEALSAAHEEMARLKATTT